MAKPTIVVDLDDTIVHCQPVYDTILARFDALRGGDGTARRIAKAIDIEARQGHEGYSRARFPRSLQAASVALDVLREQDVDHAMAERVWELGNEVFEAEYPLIEGAIETLEHYKRGGWQLVLYTLGDEAVQWKKIMRHNLQSIIPPDRIFTTSHKTTGVLLDILNIVEADRLRTWIVGDSMQHDMLPAIPLGVGTILIGTAATQPVVELQLGALSWLPKFLPADPNNHVAYVQSHTKAKLYG